jgi:hypothetical protein
MRRLVSGSPFDLFAGAGLKLLAGHRCPRGFTIAALIWKFLRFGIERLPSIDLV